MKFTSLLFLLLFVAIVAMGQFVTRDYAFELGANFYSQKAAVFNLNIKSVDIINEDVLISEDNNTCIYVFNYEDGGFILVSADKRTVPVLAYSFEGSFDARNCAPATESWINSYLQQFDIIIEENLDANDRLIEMWESAFKNTIIDAKDMKAVPAMLETRWNQNSPYNYFCPVHEAGPGGHVYAGCVATAMAQVMKFWNYPETGRGIGEYYWGDTFEVDFESTTYQWDDMSEVINTLSKEAIAELIFHCGVSVYMDYNYDGSGSSISNSFFALKQNFRYRAGVYEADKDDMEDYEWKFLLQEDLDKGHPILYRGTDEGSNGHAFVCDGYQDTSYFHFNWGWGGSADAYYYLDDINPQMSFHYGQGALINLTPNYAEYCSSMVYNQSDWTFGDGSGPNYYFNDSDCEWLIDLSMNEFDFISINFTQFDVLEGDVLRIYEGNSSSGVLIGTYTDSNAPSEIVSESDQIFLSFETNSDGQTNGWELTYETTVLGVNDDNVNQKISLFPNPAQDNITLLGIVNSVNIKIFDIAGREHIVVNDFENGSLDVSNLAAGVYILRIENREEINTLRFIKE